mmetsp:Transcript_23783/g.94305  ORF Transcript_23783/g.94305 Transcript_23783/m.94305 type:complete len:434 (-) Transcript_23783:977-2278(-)
MAQYPPSEDTIQGGRTTSREETQGVPSLRGSVRSVDVGLEGFGDDGSLELHRGGEEAVVGGPGRAAVGGDAEFERLRRLEGVQTCRLALRFERRRHGLRDGRVLRQRDGVLVFHAELLLREVDQHGGLRRDERDDRRLAGFAIDEGHLDQLVQLQSRLDLRQRDVLARGALEEIFFAVDDLEPTRRVDLADVARAEVFHAVDRHEVRLVFLDHCRVRRLRVDVIPIGDRGPAQQNLAPLPVGEGVVALGPVAQAQVRTRRRRADLRRRVISDDADHRAAARLGAAIALPHGAVEARLNEHLDLGRQRRRARGHVPHAAADERLDLLHHNRVPHGPAARLPALEALLAGAQRLREQKLLDRRALDFSLDGGVHLVEHRGREEHRRRSEERSVAAAALRQLDARVGQRVRRAVAHRGADREEPHLDGELHDVGER